MTTNGDRVTFTTVLGDHALQQYRELLDSEDEAFDELEHAFEEGNRPQFEAELTAWEIALTRKLTFLRKLGMNLPVS